MESPLSPLAGIRVIDFGHYVAGPLAGMLLADQGANVTKVSRPDASSIETPLAAVLNRGKHKVSLDLKAAAGRKAAISLIETADIVIENFRPGVMRRLGLDAEAMTARNSRLIYLSLPGFASEDLPHCQLPAWEGVIGAACGLYTDVNILKEWLGLPPIYSALPYGSVYGAVHGALSVLMALIARVRSGNGQIIEVPLASAAITAMGSSILRVATQPPRYDVPLVPRPLNDILMPFLRRLLAHIGPQWQERVYQAVRSLIPALITSYACADGRQLYIFATDHRRHARHLLTHLGLLEEMEHAGLRDCDPYVPGGGLNNLSEGSGLPRRWQRKLRKRIADKMRSKPAETWETELNLAGIPCAMQRSTSEWLSLSPLCCEGVINKVDDPVYGQMRQAGSSCWLRPYRVTDRKIASQTSPGRGSVLDGVRVLDLSTMVAGPVCARTLAEYGAEVIKIQSPHPLHGPRMTCWFGIDVDQGKRSLLLDLATDGGQVVLHRLIECADVLVHNFSPPAALRLGVTGEQLGRLNPRLVLCRLAAIEGPRAGSWDERKAYDPVLQAASGIMVRYGSAEQPEYHGLASCIDYLTGFCAAMAAALALYRRECHPQGRACEAVTSLAQGALLIQTPFAFDVPGHIRNEPSGQNCRGDHALHRLYRAKDGWLFLAAKPDQRDAVLAEPALGCPHPLASKSDWELTRILERALRRRTRAHWERVFGPLDMAAVPVRTLKEIRRAGIRPRPQSPHLRGGPSVQMIRQRHPAGGFADTLAPAYARLSHHPLRYLDPAPKPGTHSLAILKELGFTKDETQRLVDRGTAAVELCKEYLPP